MAQKIIIDTDIGDDIDDAIAISFAVRRPELEVLAITTCYGPTGKRCRMLAKQLALLGRDDIPIAAGPQALLSYANDKHEEYLANLTPTEYDFVGDEEAVRAADPRGAVDLIYDTICRHAGEVTLIPIGPLTNIATLFREHPDAAQKLKCLAIMAGNFPLQKKEYNLGGDLAASDIVLSAGLPAFLGTWGVTRRVVMLQPELDALRASDDPACRGLVEQIDLWWPHKRQKPGPVIYDVCPMVWTFDSSFFTTEEHHLRIITDGANRGCMRAAGDAPPVQVTVDMREHEVLSMLMETLLNES